MPGQVPPRPAFCPDPSDACDHPHLYSCSPRRVGHAEGWGYRLVSQSYSPGFEVTGVSAVAGVSAGVCVKGERMKGRHGGSHCPPLPLFPCSLLEDGSFDSTCQKVILSTLCVRRR